MRRYSEAVKADVRRRMSPPQRQSVAQISAELGIHIVTLYNWRKTWRLQGAVVPASEKDPEGWGATDKFTVVLETAGLTATELSDYHRGLLPFQSLGSPKMPPPVMRPPGGLSKCPLRRYSEAVKADVRRRFSPPHCQSVAQISAELGIHVATPHR